MVHDAFLVCGAELRRAGQLQYTKAYLRTRAEQLVVGIEPPKIEKDAWWFFVRGEQACRNLPNVSEGCWPGAIGFSRSG